ncbi:hypothetical protein GIB67_001630 [Kingdonia uniflora]|uniref:Uncharacterized protein n=1 Tax=Kingdonia uniflora TaxID=39325 RepID=A0A7J7L0T1_9MAGN|nr:hypothetical protein GIB67_001630 [Kingdonia uniflora]
MEPPMLVINTVLSVMAYDYPPEKLSVYLSDDGGSDLIFYALLEASRFAAHWLPFCKILNMEPRALEVYFAEKSEPRNDREWLAMKKLYEEMKQKIEAEVKRGTISEELRKSHKGFSEWSSKVRKGDHQTIFQNELKKCQSKSTSSKRNMIIAQIRVSSEISNGQVILNVDCDMYSNDPKSLKDALCFLMDEENGHKIAFVQFPKIFNNLTPNDIYGNRSTVGIKVSILKLTLICLVLQMGLKYGCPVEDIISGLAIQCRGWKSVYYNPDRKAFLGVAPITLNQSLMQHKRWSEGMFQIAFSSYCCPFTYGYGNIRLGLQMGYCVYCLWAPNSFPVIYYVVVPPLCLLNGISLFPKVSSIWFVPFAYAFIANTVFSLVEAQCCGDTYRMVEPKKNVVDAKDEFLSTELYRLHREKVWVLPNNVCTHNQSSGRRCLQEI